MKRLVCSSVLLGFISLFSSGHIARAQADVFSYQGRLTDGTNPASGIYDLRFMVFDSIAGGSIYGGPLTNKVNIPDNGIFTVTLDFGVDVFAGGDRWLEIAVRTNGAAFFQTLFDRQPITATPRAIYATTAANLTGVVAASGAGFTNLMGVSVVGAVSEALHSANATNAPDGRPIASTSTVTNIVTLINSNRVLNVLDFGVDNTGTITNTTTIAKAMTAAHSGNIRTLQFPAGVYKIASPLYITNHNVTLEALGVVVLVQTTDGADTICVTNFGSQAYNNSSISGDKFVIDPGYYTGKTNSGIGIRLYGVNGGSVDGALIENAQIKRCNIGVKYQEVSNTRFFGNIAQCAIGFESTNNGNGNLVSAFITSCSQGMVIHGGRGWNVLAQDFGAPGMTNAIVFDNASSGNLFGGNFEMYGGDLAPFKTTGKGGANWVFQNVNLPSGFSSVGTDYSFAFADDGTFVSTFSFINCSFSHTTNVGGTFEQVLINNNGRHRAFSWPLPMSVAIYSGGLLVAFNAWIGKDQLAYTPATVSPGQSYWDFSSIPPKWMVAVPTNFFGALGQINLLQYYLDTRTGAVVTNGATGVNLTGNFSGNGSGLTITNLYADSVIGGLTTNVVLISGLTTNTLFFTNGILRKVN